MNKIYDNGEMCIGSKENIIKYFKMNLSTSDMEEEIYDILKDLEDLKDNTIVVVDYDRGMGYGIDWWEESDAVKEFEDYE